MRNECFAVGSSKPSITPSVPPSIVPVAPISSYRMCLSLHPESRVFCSLCTSIQGGQPEETIGTEGGTLTLLSTVVYDLLPVYLKATSSSIRHR